MKLPRSLHAGVFLVGALAAFLPAVLAPDAASAQSAVCSKLEASLAALDRSGGGGNAAQTERLRGDLDRLSSQYRNLNCDAPRGFLIFEGPPRPPQCDQLSSQISRVRSAIAGAQGSGGDVERQRAQIRAAMAQNQCGAGGGGGGSYGQSRSIPVAAPAAPPPQQAPAPQRPRNFLEMLFGVPAQSQPEPEAVSPEIDQQMQGPLEQPKSSYFRTVCVRTCDGFFFPISSAAGESRFARDEALCKRLCPATEAQLFTYRSYGEDIKSANSVEGQPYMSLANALRFRKEYVPGCSCKAAGQSWAQALAGLEDQSTLRKGDILVTEEQSREMSQPRVADPPKSGARKSAQTAAAPAAEPSPLDEPQAATNATSAAPLAPQSEQPGQRSVRIIPMHRPAAPPKPETESDADQ